MNYGRKEPCKNTIGGVKAIYLMDFVKYPRHKIELSADKTQLLSFPITIIYELQLRAATNYQQELQEDLSVKQNIEIALKKDSLTTMNEVRTLLKKELRLIAEDRMGQYWLMGLHNGVTITNYSRSTGGAKGDFNGYNLTFEGMEENFSPYISDLNNTGFIPPLEGKEFWLSSNDTILSSSDKLSSEIYI